MSQRKTQVTFDQYPRSQDRSGKFGNFNRLTAIWRDHGTQVRLPTTDGAASLSDQLFVQLNQRLDESARTKPASSTAHMDLVLLHGKNPGLVPIFERIGDEFHSLAVYRSKAYAFRSASRRTGSRTVFALDLDLLGYIDRAIPKLMRLRARNPALSVLLLSSQIKGDDFSMEREAIADACISLPTDASSIMRGIRYAMNNARKRSEA